MNRIFLILIVIFVAVLGVNSPSTASPVGCQFLSTSGATPAFTETPFPECAALHLVRGTPISFTRQISECSNR